MSGGTNTHFPRARLELLWVENSLLHGVGKGENAFLFTEKRFRMCVREANYKVQ